MDIDIIDIVAVDDKAPAYTDKQVAVGAKLFPNHILHLPELEREHSRLVVGLYQVAIIPVRRDKHNLVGGNAHQVSRSGYDQILLQHDEAKVATPSECKYRLFVEMYEIGLKMYEMVNNCPPSHNYQNFGLSLSNGPYQYTKEIRIRVNAVSTESDFFSQL